MEPCWRTERNPPPAGSGQQGRFTGTGNVLVVDRFRSPTPLNAQAAAEGADCSKHLGKGWQARASEVSSRNCRHRPESYGVEERWAAPFAPSFGCEVVGAKAISYELIGSTGAGTEPAKRRP